MRWYVILFLCATHFFDVTVKKMVKICKHSCKNKAAVPLFGALST